MTRLFRAIAHGRVSLDSGVKEWFRRSARKSPLILLCLAILWSVGLGVGLARASDPTIGTVDPVAERYQFSQELYFENCATCHIAVPPAVLPDAAWRQLLLNPDRHYGVQLQPLVDPPRILIWSYLRDFSRPLMQGEQIPYGIDQSRYFKALHPRVEFTEPIRIGNCITCHPGAPEFNFRRLTAEWNDAP